MTSRALRAFLLAVVASAGLLIAPQEGAATHHRGVDAFAVVSNDGSLVITAISLTSAAADSELEGTLLLQGELAILECMQVAQDRDGYLDLKARFRQSDAVGGDATKKYYVNVHVPSQGVGEVMFGVSRSSNSEDQCGAARVEADASGHSIWMDVSFPG